MAALVLSLLAALPQLGAEDYATRESATRRLQSAGPLAWGLLWPRRWSECPEVRDRAFRLTRAAEAALSDAEAIRTWFAGDAPTAERLAALHDDAAARYRLYWSARRLGLSGELPDPWDTGPFFPGAGCTRDALATLRDATTDSVRCWNFGLPSFIETKESLDALRSSYRDLNPAAQENR
jgi:hypothetical protein